MILKMCIYMWIMIVFILVDSKIIRRDLYKEAKEKRKRGETFSVSDGLKDPKTIPMILASMVIMISYCIVML